MNNMEDNDQIIEESQDLDSENPEPAKPKRDLFLPAAILISVLVLSGAWIYTAGLKAEGSKSVKSEQNSAQAADALAESITPSAGVVLPVRWSDLGRQMAQAGVVDEAQFKALYAQRGGVPSDVQSLLDSSDNGNLKITPQNSGAVLNLLWAFGLGNKNRILEQGPMQDPKYGGAGRFASTGGWTIAVGDAMSHYSKHQFASLTSEQQSLVENVAKNVYRPCCGNATYFPDCNHGMAMLGLLELMASQGATENQMYQAALAVNSYWFPDTYRTIARYFESKGVKWNAVSPVEVLSAGYSSSQGYSRIQPLVPAEPSTQQQGGCGVDAGAGQPAAQPQRQQGGCGV